MVHAGGAITITGRVDRYRRVRFTTWLCGALMLIVWLFALEQAFMPTDIYPGGFYQSCGSSAFFDRGKVTLSDTGGYPSPPKIVDECERDAEDHIGTAVVAAIVASPLTLVCCFGIKQLRRLRVARGETAIEASGR